MPVYTIHPPYSASLGRWCVSRVRGTLRQPGLGKSALFLVTSAPGSEGRHCASEGQKKERATALEDDRLSEERMGKTTKSIYQMDSL